MSYCPNPHCLQPQSDTALCCAGCQTDLRLNYQYRLIKIIGQGGMGRTFLAVSEQDELPKPFYIIKQFLPQTQNIVSRQKAAELFISEAVLLNELGQHPHIPQLYDYFSQNQNQYLVQEWVEGESLAHIINHQGVVCESEVTQILRSLLLILTFVHEHHIVHRDIKPDNIICRQDKTLVLVDFGAAKVLETKYSAQTGTVIGSPEYIAPEQLRGKSVFGSDIYSLGVTCLYLLTGVSPFDLYSDSEDTWIWRNYLGTNSVSSELGAILDKMIARATAKRYPSARAVLKDLKIEIFNDSPAIVCTPTTDKNLSNLGSTTPNPIDCTQLQNLLENKQWREANQETASVLLKAARQERRDWLERNDVANISCNDLLIIDRLWRNHSQKRFGFTVQLDLWQNLEPQNYQQFGKQVGWHRQGRWILMRHLDFGPNAPVGHLPAISWWFGHAIWGLKILFSRLDFCQLQEFNSESDE